MNPNKALWEKGDFTRIAASMRESGEALVKELAITTGLKVLDLGCGDGTTALPAAKLGADVLGVDIASNLVAGGEQRAPRTWASPTSGSRRATRPICDDLDDDRFDLVVSIFGAMFAPKPFDVAKEMVRVTRPGGRIVMGNWIPNDPTLVAQILKISSAYSPPPPEGFVSPMTWGVEADVIERFTAAGIPEDNVVVRPRHVPLQLPRAAGEVRRRVPDLLRADDERLRGGRGTDGRTTELQRSSSRSSTRRTTARPTDHVDPGNLPACDGRSLMGAPPAVDAPRRRAIGRVASAGRRHGPGRSWRPSWP